MHTVICIHHLLHNTYILPLAISLWNQIEIVFNVQICYFRNSMKGQANLYMNKNKLSVS